MRVSLASFCPWGAWPPIQLRFSARPPSLGAICAACWRVGAGSLVLCGPSRSRRLGRGGGSRSGSSLGRGGGATPPASGGGGRGPRGLRASWMGGGGGWRRGLPAPLLGGGLRYSILVVSSLPSGVRVRSGSRCRPGVGGGEGRPVDRSPGGPCRPEPPLCPP